MTQVAEVAQAEEQTAARENGKAVAPPTLEENLLKTRETLENVVESVKFQILNNFDGFLSAIRQEVPKLTASQAETIKLLLEHMLKSPIKRQMNRISSVAIAVSGFKP